ncbi:hypothetical protein CBL_13205 [Carabus blaptoides fortunei]
MMGQFEKNDNQESGTEDVVEQKISEQDIFTFCKELPRSTDSPFFGILRKRKLPDHPEDGITPASKSYLKDKVTRKSKGVAFIFFVKREFAQKCVDKVNMEEVYIIYLHYEISS